MIKKTKPRSKSKILKTNASIIHIGTYLPKQNCWLWSGRAEGDNSRPSYF